MNAKGAVVERAYTYDAAGQLVARADSLRGRQDFRYDPTGRILAAMPSALAVASGAGSISTYNAELFAFDPAGNLLPEKTSAHDGTSAGSTTDGVIFDNRLRFYQDLAFEYDEHGNVTRRVRGNQAGGNHADTQLTWNQDHQLTQATVTRHGVTQTTSYAYDPLGRRVAKIDAFGSTHYLWDGDLMIHSQRGNKEALFVFEPNSFVPLATVQGISKDRESQQTYWYQCDQIGAPQELTDQQGHIVWAADYKVWGEAKLRAIVDWPRTGTDGGLARGAGISAGSVGNWSDAGRSSQTTAPPIIEQPFRFQGQQFDEETGLHYNRFRYYDPAVGRFTSQDPIGLLGGFNVFYYAPNPLRWIDVFGLSCNCPIHHICTNKNDKSTARGGPWSPRFKQIFDKAGYDMDDAINKIGVPGHAGPHPEAYHSEVLNRLQAAVKGKSGEAYKKAFEDEMSELKKDATDPNHKLNKLLCK